MADFASHDYAVEFDTLRNKLNVSKRRSRQIEVILRLYIVFGLLLAATALTYFAFSFLRIELSAPQRVSLIAAGSGLTVAIMSAVVLAYRRERIEMVSESYKIIEQDFDLIREWAQFEHRGRKVLEQKGINFNHKSPRLIATALAKEELIPEELVERLSMALDIRNKVVHEAEPVPQPTIRAAAETLHRLNTILAKVLQGVV